MGEPIKKGDYIGEYVGEVVSREEGERRGLIYDKRNLSYLFDLNISRCSGQVTMLSQLIQISPDTRQHTCRKQVSIH